MASDTKTALLDFAEQAARSRGFDGFSYADLAKSVGIRKASIHYHFPTKAELSEALMDRYHETISAKCAEIIASSDKASDRLLGLIDLYRMALNEGRTLCLCVSFTASHQSLSDAVNAKISAFRSAIVKWLQSVFVLGQEDASILGVTEPKLEAFATLAVLEGAHLAARADEDVAVFDQAVAVITARCK